MRQFGEGTCLPSVDLEVRWEARGREIVGSKYLLVATFT